MNNSTKLRKHQLPYVSVYCITYNQREVLIRTISGLFHQDYDRSMFEIIVLDDGSNDGSLEYLKAMQEVSPVRFKIISVNHTGDYLSAKRFNQCIAQASPWAVAFVHIEDAYVKPDFVMQHIKWHMQDVPALVSGAIFEGESETWDFTSCERARVYAKFGRPLECDFRAIWAKSMSYSRESMERIWREPYDRPFDERMTGWGYHEVEFAWRMHQAGVKMVYDPAAGVYHPPHTEATESARGFDREELLGCGRTQNLHYLLEKHSVDGEGEWILDKEIDWLSLVV